VCDPSGGVWQGVGRVSRQRVSKLNIQNPPNTRPAHHTRDTVVAFYMLLSGIQQCVDSGFQHTLRVRLIHVTIVEIAHSVYTKRSPYKWNWESATLREIG
jgi:hypothetical protein